MLFIGKPKGRSKMISNQDHWCEIFGQQFDPRELPWIESGSLVREVWSAVEYGGIPDFLG